jgi:uncharacterized protein
MKSKGHVPMRTCISCGAKQPKGLLIRLAADNENHMVKDASARMKGRGAYVCNAQTCLERLAHKKHLKRYFRTDREISIGHEILGVISFEIDR